MGKNKWMAYVNLQDWPLVMNPMVEETEHTSLVEEEYAYVVDKVQIVHLDKTIID
jgi:hypothetical protein